MRPNTRFDGDKVRGMFWHYTMYNGERKVALHGIVGGSKCKHIMIDEPPIDLEGAARKLYKAVQDGTAEACILEE